MRKEPKIIRNTIFQYPSNSTQVSIFRGTSKMNDYEHVTTKTIKKIDNALSNILGMYGTDSENDNEASDIDNDLTDSTHVPCIVPKLTTDRPNADSSERELNYSAIPLVENINICSSSSDEGPDDVPIERHNEPISQTAIQNLRCPLVPKSIKPATETNTKRPLPKKIHSGLNYKRARQFNNQNTMLSKLLERDIRHERNVLLQCVRYVCERNFFDICKKFSELSKT